MNQHHLYQNDGNKHANKYILKTSSSPTMQVGGANGNKQNAVATNMLLRLNFLLAPKGPTCTRNIHSARCPRGALLTACKMMAHRGG